jgi:hypothetical protein
MIPPMALQAKMLANNPTPPIANACFHVLMLASS